MLKIREVLKRPADLRYAFDKGGAPFLRGLIWQVLRLRRPNIFFLGAGVKFVSAGNLRIGRRVSIGAHSYIETSALEPVVFADNVTLRENAWIQSRSGFNAPGDGLVLGERVYIGPNAVIGVSGKITICAGTQIGAGVSFTSESHEFHEGGYTTGATRRKGIWVGPNCWFGNSVTVLDGVKIGEGSVVGAGSVVTRSLPARCIAVGVPARVIRMQNT